MLFQSFLEIMEFEYHISFNHCVDQILTMNGAIKQSFQMALDLWKFFTDLNCSILMKRKIIEGRD